MRNAAIILVLFGCSSTEPAVILHANDYMALRMGAYQIYSVDSTVIRQNVATTYNFQLKTIVSDSFPNGDGGYTYTIQRFKRITNTSPWLVRNTWSARTDAYQAVVNEGNISYIKIASPLFDGKAWNGNALNDLGGTEKCINQDSHWCDIYTLQGTGKSYTSPTGETFSNTITVSENNNNDEIVLQDKRSEVYGVDRGLLFREVIYLEFCTDASCVGSQLINKGLRYQQSIIEYGG